MLGLNDSELVAAALAFLLPLLIAVIQQPRWNDLTRALVALGVVFLWTVLAVLVLSPGGGYAWQSALRLLLMVFLISSVAYLAVWKPMGVTQRIEDLTSPRDSAPSRPVAGADRRAGPRDGLDRNPMTPPPPPARRPDSGQTRPLRRTRP